MPPIQPTASPRQRRLLAAAFAALLAVAPSAGPVAADHGGRPIGALFSCDRPVTPPRCTSVGDNPRHLIFIDPSFGPDLAASLRDAIAVYDATKLIVIEQARRTRMTDVIAFSRDYGENGAAGWVYCPSNAPQGTNSSGHRWCRQQELHLNVNARYAAFFDDDASRDHVTCHELGHTVGLRHWGNPPQTSGDEVGATCMNANTPNGPIQLHQIDVDHINRYPYRQRRDSQHRPLPASTERERRQLLPWAGSLDADEVERASSLAELTLESDAVVRGRIVAVAPGRVFGGLHYAAATLRVDDLVAGSVPTRGASTVTLEIPLFDGPQSIDRLPDWGEALFFLRNKGESARLAGLSPSRQSEERAFHRLMSFSSLVVNDAGSALTDPDSPPLAPLAGSDFDDVVDQVRAIGR